MRREGRAKRRRLRSTWQRTTFTSACYRCARARASHLPLISAKVVSLLLDLQQQGGRGDSLKYGSRRRVIC